MADGPALLNDPKIPTREPQLAELFFFANPSTGLGGKNTIAVLLAMIAANASAPVKTYSSRSEMLANISIPVGYFAFVTNNGAGWGLYYFKGPDRATLTDYQLILSEKKDTDNQWIDCGQFTGDALPTLANTTGGTGYAGEILRGNTFDVADNGSGVGATIDGVYYPPGTTFRALIDNPTLFAHWRIHA